VPATLHRLTARAALAFASGEKAAALVTAGAADLLTTEGKAMTAVNLDAKTAPYREKFWGGKNLPFPVALASGK
jgi:hypothetical protein